LQGFSKWDSYLQFLKISRKRAKCRSLSFLDGTKGYGASFLCMGQAPSSILWPTHSSSFSLPHILFFLFLSPYYLFFLPYLIFFFFYFSSTASNSFSSLMLLSSSTMVAFLLLVMTTLHSYLGFFFSIRSKTSRRIVSYLLA